MRPMLARTLGPKFNQFPCYVQPKLNGVRALYQDGELWEDAPGVFQSRDEKVWAHQVLEHLHKELKSIKKLTGDLILDGELYVHGWRLQRINGAIAVNRLEPNDDTRQVEFHVFDVVDPKKSFSERYFDVMHDIARASLPHIKFVQTDFVANREQLDGYFHAYTQLGYEGIMLRPDGPYEFGEHLGRGGTMTSYRSRTLWKHKQWEDGEWHCVGWTRGEGKADIGIGALVLARKDAVIVEKYDGTATVHGETFKVGTGFTDEERIEFMNNPPIRKKVKVRYLCLTADGIPFNPSFLCVMQ
jgi:ATP-dependent DNA ligase